MNMLVSVGELARSLGLSTVEAEGGTGVAPQLMWLAIADLVVDRGYQRPIGPTGLRNIMGIARAFSWAKFSPVVVAPVEGGAWAIVDGQYRTLAASVVGIERVPCTVIMVDRADQAQAFVSINGRVTRMSPLALHKAAAIGGDERAQAIERVATAADVKVLAYPKSEISQSPGETMAVQAIGQLIDQGGEEMAALVLAIIRRQAGERPGCLLMTIIKAVGERARELVAEGKPLGALPQAFAGVDLVREFGHAKMAPARPGEALWTRMLARLRSKVA